jgi:hypothetical protein
VSDIDTGVVDSLKALDPDGRLEKRTHVLQHFRAPIHVAVDCPRIGALPAPALLSKGSQ